MAIVGIGIGIGIIPATAPLLAAGAQGGNGVAVDQFCATSLPHIYAIGDCALHPSYFAAGASVRFESIQNANDMANTVAKVITGAPEPYAAVPWFWSNQFELRLQTAGLFAEYTSEVVRGTPSQRSFSVVYLKAGKIIAIDCMNAPRDFMQAKAVIAAGRLVDAVMLADLFRPISDCVL